jgi:hypothetical protein
MPPPLSVNATVYVLHAVDLFRRRAYEAYLDPGSADPAVISADEFLSRLQRSLEARDLRWLAPAFIGLTPGLPLSGLGAGAADLARLVELDVLLPAKDGGGRRLVFGEAGKRMGVEFQHSWFSAVGFQIADRDDDGWRVRARGFLAPTGLANHLFLVADNDGSAGVNHQALTRDMLDRALTNLFVAAPGARPGRRPQGKRAAAEATKTAAPAPEAPKLFCSRCGTELAATRKFCTNCGAAVRAPAAAGATNKPQAGPS